MNETDDAVRGAGLGGETLGLFLELRKTATTYAYYNPWDVLAIEEGGRSGGLPTTRVELARFGARYCVNVLGAAREIARQVDEARRRSIDGLLYGLLADTERSTLESRVREAILREVRQQMGEAQLATVEQLVPQILDKHLALVAGLGDDGGGAADEPDEGRERVEDSGEKRVPGAKRPSRRT